MGSTSCFPCWDLYDLEPRSNLIDIGVLSYSSTRKYEQAILRPDDVFIVRCSHVSGLEALLLISAIACFWRTTGVVKPLVRFVFLAYQRETRSSHHDI